MQTNTNNHVLSQPSLPKGSRSKRMTKGRRTKMKWNPDDFHNIRSTQNISFVQSFHVYPQPEQPVPLQRNARAPHFSFLCLIPSRALSSSHTGLLVSPDTLCSFISNSPLYSGFLADNGWSQQYLYSFQLAECLAHTYCQWVFIKLRLLDSIQSSTLSVSLDYLLVG